MQDSRWTRDREAPMTWAVGAARGACRATAPCRRRASFEPSLRRLTRLAASWCLMAIPLAAAGAPALPALGAHTLIAQPDHEGVAPAVSAPLDTAASGSSLLVLVGGFVSNESTPADTYDNAWKEIGSRVVFRGYNGRFSTRAFVATDAKGGPAQRIRIAKPDKPTRELTAPVIEIRNAGTLQSFAQNYPDPTTWSRYATRANRAWHRLLGTPPTGGATITSGKVTTTGPATLVAVWWGDAMTFNMTAVPNNGFKVIDSYLDLPPVSGVQCAVAVKQVDRAGTWDVSWTGTPAQGAILWLFAFQSQR